jgi:hypothetical protein
LYSVEQFPRCDLLRLKTAENDTKVAKNLLASTNN